MQAWIIYMYSIADKYLSQDSTIVDQIQSNFQNVTVWLGNIMPAYVMVPWAARATCFSQWSCLTKVMTWICYKPFSRWQQWLKCFQCLHLPYSFPNLFQVGEILVAPVKSRQIVFLLCFTICIWWTIAQTRTIRTPAFWGYPCCLMITHTIESYWIPSEKKTRSKLQI